MTELVEVLHLFRCFTHTHTHTNTQTYTSQTSNRRPSGSMMVCTGKFGHTCIEATHTLPFAAFHGIGHVLCVATHHTHTHTYIPTYLHTYIPTYLHTYIPTYLHTYIPTYLHTHIPTYLHARRERKHIHTHTHTLPNSNTISCLPNLSHFNVTFPMCLVGRS